MHLFLILLLIFLAIYSCVSWLLPTLLAWLFKRKYHIRLKIGRIAVPKLVLKDISLSKDGYSIHIEEISFRSSFFNSEINKLLCVVVKNVNITNNVEEKRSVVVETILKPLLSKQNSANSRVDQNDDNLAIFNEDLNRDLNELTHRKLLDFREKKLPQSLIVFAQFMGIHIFNASVTYHKGTGSINNCILQASVAEIHTDGTAGGPAKALVFSATLVDVSMRLLQADSLKCMGELTCGLLVEGAVKADGPVNVEKIHTVINDPIVTLQGDLYGFIQIGKSKKRSTTVVEVYEDHFSTLIQRMSPVIPKTFSLRIEGTKVNYTHETTLTNFQYSLESLQVNSRFSASCVLTETMSESMPQWYVAFQMDQLRLNAGTDGLLFLNKLKLDAKLEKGVLNLYLIISVLNLLYNHKHIYTWYRNSFKRVKTAQSMQLTEKQKPSVPAWMQYLFDNCVVQGCAELRAVTLHASLPEDKSLTLGCGGLKVKLDQLNEAREEPYKSTIPRLVVGCRHWSTEVLIDAGWCKAGIGSSLPQEPPHKKLHTWGTTLLLGVALVKWGSHGSKDSKVEAMMDCLRFEWSNTLATTIIAAIQCLNQYKEEKIITDSPPQVKSKLKVTVNVAMSHINLFFIINDSMCLMMRVDAVSVDRNFNKTGVVISGLKVVEMDPYKGTVSCQRSEDIVTKVFHAKLTRIDHIPPKKTNSSLLDLQFLENVDFQWSANLHLKVLTFVRAVNMFKEEIRGVMADNEGQVKVEKHKRRLDWRCSFKGETNMAFVLSKQNNMLLLTDDTTISYEHASGLSVCWAQVKVVLNGDQVVVVDGYSMERVTDDPNIRVERKANEHFKLPWNKVWGVNVESVRVIFPYKHRFAETIQGDFVSLFKWIKVVHNITKKPFTAESPLPSDLCIKIDELLIEMSDDPFEVKLRDNYELLEDEYIESERRKTMLDAKVQELCKSHLFLPAGKVEELYAALQAKDAQIYVQRCRAAPPPRTRLVACTLSQLSVLALADPSLHGTSNATALLRDIDTDTPWPEEGLECSTLWCRAVNMQCSSWQLLLRDFPQPLLSLRNLRTWGLLLGAEGAPPARAVRTVVIEQGAPWGGHEVERSMMPLKFYHDLCCEMDEFSYAFGPCWEPVIAQCNLAFDQVSRPSLDPSQPLAWWDKVRLLMHGRLTATIAKFTCLLHVSLDPYNTTEEMELTWIGLVLDWTNGKLGFLGELNVYVRTASKYDDCRVLHVPEVRLSVKLGWQTGADPRDHHAVAPCAPGRLPEYSSNQEHDSYRAFRSHGLDLCVNMDTKAADIVGPVILLYGSTLRWFESLKLILSGITRPTRRGRVFNNVRPRKLQLSRHYRAVSVAMTLHNMQVFYWSSSSKQRGFEILGVRVTCGSKHSLSLVPTVDGLVRRPRANWTTVYMNCDLNDAEIWLKSALLEDNKDRSDDESEAMGLNTIIEKCYCLSVRRVSYGREAAGVGGTAPAHRLAVHDLRGAWTKLNRDVAFALLDTYIKTQQLKKNLSTKALKEDDIPATSPKHQRDTDMVSPPPATAGMQSPWGAGGSGMLARLVAEAGGEPPVVLPDELSGEPEQPHPHQLDDDNAHTACLIELVNSQVLLKGCETRGYVIICAARAEVRQRVRKTPAATAWSGNFSAMQYYATVGDTDLLHENIQWVSVEEISERWSGADINTLPDVPRLVGSGHSAGSVVGRTVGPSADTDLTQMDHWQKVDIPVFLATPQGINAVKLQRIVSRCACEFYYVSHEEAEGRGAGAERWGAQQRPYDSFTLMHHDLDVCTNSLQYAMLLDVVNSAVLYVEPERRRTLERRARMRFQMQLQRDRDPRTLIHSLQTQVRESLIRLRRLEKEYYMKRRTLAEDDTAGIKELKGLDAQVNECKENVWSLGDELDAMVRAWREARARADMAPQPRAGSTHAPPHRLHEICFKSARWRLTDADGQLGIADLLLTNFLYTKTSRSDDSVEHQLELGFVQVTNLLPNEPFPEVLVPQAPSGRVPLGRRAALRVFCRDRPPVGGISVKEHFEVNIVPIRIGLTKKFFNTMLKFCFPERDPDTIEGMDGEEDDGGSVRSAGGGSKKIKKRNKDSNSNFYVKRDKDKDDVEKMKERAEKNKLFIYIKIPEVPVRVSYKGSKEKNLEDVRELPLVLPTLEYHNVTWTWLDLLLATKTDTRRVLVSQAIRQKLQLHRRSAAAPEPHEEDKARLLLGERTVAENKPHKKGQQSVFKFSKS